jgi:hypothetical protein
VFEVAARIVKPLSGCIILHTITASHLNKTFSCSKYLNVTQLTDVCLNAGGGGGGGELQPIKSDEWRA